MVPWAKAGVGAIATQAMANPQYGPEGLDLLSSGIPPAKVIERLLAEDPGKESRQIGIVDAEGRVAAYTGPATLPFAGHKIGSHYTCQGNLLAGERVLEAMGRTFERAKGELADRLLEALIAGERAGGDRRGRQSAALLVVRKGGGSGGLSDRVVDLRIDDHRDPVSELARLLALRKKSFAR